MQLLWIAAKSRLPPSFHSPATMEDKSPHLPPSDYAPSPPLATSDKLATSAKGTKSTKKEEEKSHANMQRREG